MDLLKLEPILVTKLVFACRVPPGNGNHVHKDRPRHGIALRTEGRVIYHFSDGRDLVNDAESTALIYLPKYSSYWVEILEQGPCYAINFDVAIDLHCPPAVLATQSMVRVRECFRAANRSWRSQNPARRESCMANLYEILSTLKAEQAQNAAPYPPPLQKALEQIEIHYTDGAFSVSSLRRLCGVSETYLRQLFQRYFDMATVQYIRKLRLSRAAELIETGLYTIGEAAALSGFLDDSYFSREFRKEYGVSPRQYAK